VITYRAVALYQGNEELSEGFGSSKSDAIAEAREGIPSIYPREDVTFDIYEEAL